MSDVTPKGVCPKCSGRTINLEAGDDPRMRPPCKCTPHPSDAKQIAAELNRDAERILSGDLEFTEERASWYAARVAALALVEQPATECRHGKQTGRDCGLCDLGGSLEQKTRAEWDVIYAKQCVNCGAMLTCEKCHD